MNTYELIVILSSGLEEEQRKKLVEKISLLIEGFKGKVEKVDQWGKRELTYSLKKQKQGFYVQINFSLDQKKMPELVKKIKAEDHILRYLFMRI